MGYIILFTLLYAALFLLLYFSAFAAPARENAPGQRSTAREYLPYAGVLLLIFLLELWAAQIIPGHREDSGLFRAWTSFGLEHKMSEYYTTDLYVDYPPVYLSLLYGVGKLAALFGIDPGERGYLVVIKFIPILCDSIFTVFLFVMAKEKMGLKKAGALALLSALSPAMILNSAIWGQTDSFVLLLTLAMLFTLYNKKHAMSCALLALCFLTKPQTVIYAPLVGFTVLADLVQAGKEGETWPRLILRAALCLAATAAVLLIVPLPVTGLRYDLLYERYVNAVGMYAYATVNAANLYGAFGLNWAEVTERFFGLSCQAWGYLFIVLMSLTVGFVSFWVRDRRKILYLGAFTVSTIFMLAHTMHERYLYALMPLLLLLYIATQNRKLLLLYGAFTLTNFWNVSVMLIVDLQKTFIYGDNVPFILLSWAQVLLYAAMLAYFYRTLKEKRKAELRELRVPAKKRRASGTAGGRKRPGEALLRSGEGDARIRRVDVCLMAGLSLLYSVFAFWSLGSTKVPESGWYAEDGQESVVVDLGERREVEQIYAYPGWIDRRRSDQDVKREIGIEISDDAQTWEPLVTGMELSDVWRWCVTDVAADARYLRFTPDEGRFYLNELAFYGVGEEDRYFPVAAYSSTGNETAAALIDEQERVRYEFDWRDGTYFDEIYHPRTAYENLTHRYPYENTHPPLGKLIIALGVAIFGMNPFGWRFFGALCGVLMVPVAYMLGKRMFKSTFFAFAAAFLFTFDFMHLTQTRIATIDSYTTFFVMGMYYFMYQYLSRSFYDGGVKKTLFPLFWSGVFFGLGAATKWQGIYAGAGLAVLFFANLFYRWAEYRRARKSAARDERTRRIVAEFKRSAGQTILFGALFFVVIPGVIYFLSYIPAMLTPTTGLKFFFTNQPSMYHYHSELKAEHAYGSAWWSWPLDLRPLYAYSPNRRFVPKGTSMGISSFGNPLVWWMTIPVIIGGIVQTVRKKGSREMTLILVGFLSMYLPWVLVPRVAFIYHFFPCVIFVTLEIVAFMKQLIEKNAKRKKYAYVYLAAVFALFVAFYPVLVGIAVPTAYVQCLKWLPTWVLG